MNARSARNSAKHKLLALVFVSTEAALLPRTGIRVFVDSAMITRPRAERYLRASSHENQEEDHGKAERRPLA
ncbi:MAG TPA: hypothetical protein VFW41_00120 [Gaiellaceae bacterium]|nr:hypothetical protein [Gaiellaceae bacterium]